MPSSSEEEDEDEELTQEQKRLRKAFIWAKKLVARRARQKAEQDAASKKWQEEQASGGTKWTKFHKSEKKASTTTEATDAANPPAAGVTKSGAPLVFTGTAAERALLLARLTAFYAKHNPEKPVEEIQTGAYQFASEKKEKELNKGLRTTYDDDLDSFPASDYPAEFTAVTEERAAKKAEQIQKKVDKLLRPGDGPNNLRGKLIAFYAAHDPSKLNVADVDPLVARYESKAKLFLEALCTKYKVDAEKAILDTGTFYATRNQDRALKQAAIKAEAERLRREDERLARRGTAAQPPRFQAPAPAPAPFAAQPQSNNTTTNYSPGQYAYTPPAQPAAAGGQFPPGMPPASGFQNATHYPAQFAPPAQQWQGQQAQGQQHPFAPPRNY